MESNTILKLLSDFKMFQIQHETFYDRILSILEMMSTMDIEDKLIGECLGELLHIALPENMDENDHRLERFFNWLCEIYWKNEYAEFCAIRVISKIIKYNTKYRSWLFKNLFCPQSPIYERILGDKIKNDLYVLSVLECLNAIFNDLKIDLITEEQKQSCGFVLTLLIRMHYSLNINSLQNPNITLYCLILLNKYASFCKQDIELNISELMGISLGFIEYGLNIKSVSIICPELIKPSHYLNNASDEQEIVEPIIHHKFGGKQSKKRHRGLKPKESVNTILETANNGFGELDSEMAMINNMEKTQCDVLQNEISSRIRLASIILFGQITRSIKRHVLYTYWQSIFPYDGVDNVCARKGIIFVCQAEVNSKCRSAALNVCAEVLLNLKPLYSQAEFKDRSSAFLPFSHMLGLSIITTYKALIDIIHSEKCLNVLTQALKCLAALAEIAPFAKLECEIVANIINTVKNLVHHNDYTIQISALSVLEVLLMDTEMPSEIAEALGMSKECIPTSSSNENFPSIGFTENVNKENCFDRGKERTDKYNFEASWLILKIISNLEMNLVQDNTICRKIKTPCTLRIKSLHILTAMAIHFEFFLKDNLEKLTFVLRDSIHDGQLEVRLCGSKCMEACVYQMNLFLQNNCNNDNICSFKCFWTCMFPIITHQMSIEKESTAVKIALCDAISNIGAIIFENLSEPIRINLLSFLSGLSCDSSEDVLVRATVVRALSVFVTFPTMHMNFVFIENTAELILRLAGEGNMTVRIKVIWSMGNISDALLENISDNTAEKISDEILWRLIQYSTEACNDCDKVRCNAVRTLGNLLRLLTEKHFHHISDRTVIKSAISKLIDGIRSSGTAKVKWNSCYAVGKVLQNERIFQYSSRYKDLTWQLPLFSALCHVIYNHPNYKVKINATAALIHIKEREYFGEHYSNIWSALLEAIEQSNNLINFYEYNHRDQLQEQMCFLICHIIKLANLQDIIILSRVLFNKLEIVKNTWMRVLRRLLPGKAAPLLSCSTHLNDLLKSPSELSMEQKNAILLVMDAIPTSY
ncbi:HEAT repeat-containing protein 6 [Bactrocera neohumeralis]|uniref:HEAT repeat-containing protein 6 n=1 Tax=Bactrocera neohumeralis TaxID=98809 RepID=UPI002166A99C|nr:HEAT repeat-containing protein 6 [Bactrocera neohumeralis]